MWGLLAIGVMFLYIFYLLQKRKYKKQLIKLKEKYNETENKSRPSAGKTQAGAIRERHTTGDGRTDDNVVEGEPVDERNDEPTGRILLPTTTNIKSIDDESEHRELDSVDTKPKKRLSIRRRK